MSAWLGSQYAALAARGRPLVLDDFPIFLPSREAAFAEEIAGDSKIANVH